MWKARGAFGALSLRPYAMAIVGALAIWLGFGSALAQGLYDDPSTAEGWAWSQIERSEAPDFNERCHTPTLDPRDENDARWQDDCRKLSARFLQDLLMRAPWREATPLAGIQIVGARIVDNIDLDNAKLIRAISILNSRIEGAINLLHARTDSLIWLEGSLMTGPFHAVGLHSENDLFLRDSVFKSEADLSSAKIDGSVDLTGAKFDRNLRARRSQIGGELLMNSDDRNKASFKDVDLTGAKVAGQLIMLGASIDGLFIASRLKVGDNLFASSVGQYQTRFRDLILNGAEIAGTVSFIGAGFDGALHASQLQVGGTLFMNSDAQNKASFKDVDLTGAKVTGSVHMGGASFDGVLEASFLQVGGSLLMASIAPNRANFENDVNLRSAKIAGQIDMTDASFDGGLNADYLQVGGHLFMRQAHYAGDVVMVFAHVGGNLDLRGATLARLDLSGASVAGELRLGSTVWTPKNGESGSLDLRNTNVGNLMDAKDAWPAQGELHLNGFTFGRLGGSGGQAGLEMRARGMEWWDNWVRLDPDYSPILYEQLAAAFTSSGDRNAANEIRYLGLERKRTAACEQHAWTACLILTTQSFLTGYGIGLRVLYSVIFLSLASAALLWGTVPAAKQHGFIWCFGASLAQLLPVIQLNKEFTEFFYDPERTRLKGWQVFVFSSLGVIGLALGATLIIAVSGLTQGP